MAKLSKRATAINAKVDRNKVYPVADALTLVKETATAKFDESVDAVVNLGIDARKSDQLVRGALVLPNGTGKTKRVAVFAQGAQADAAKAAGAEFVGFEDLAEQVKGGMLDFDVAIATPDATVDLPAGLSKAAFFDAIVKERSLELGGEGIRKYDLIRWNLL